VNNATVAVFPPCPRLRRGAGISTAAALGIAEPGSRPAARRSRPGVAAAPPRPRRPPATTQRLRSRPRRRHHFDHHHHAGKDEPCAPGFSEDEPDPLRASGRSPSTSTCAGARMLMPTRSASSSTSAMARRPAAPAFSRTPIREHLEGDPVRRRQGEKARQATASRAARWTRRGQQCRTRTVTVNSAVGTTTATIDAPKPGDCFQAPSVEAQPFGLGDRHLRTNVTSRPTSLASRHRHSQHRSEGRSQTREATPIRRRSASPTPPRIHRPGRPPRRARGGTVNARSHRDRRVSDCSWRVSLSDQNRPSDGGAWVERPVRRGGRLQWRSTAPHIFPARGRAYGVDHSSRAQRVEAVLMESEGSPAVEVDFMTQGRGPGAFV